MIQAGDERSIEPEGPTELPFSTRGTLAFHMSCMAGVISHLIGWVIAGHLGWISFLCLITGTAFGLIGSIQIAFAADSHEVLRRYLIDVVEKLERVGDIIAVLVIFPLFTGGLVAGLAWLVDGQVSIGFLVGLSGGGLYVIWTSIVLIRKAVSKSRVSPNRPSKFLALVAITIAGRVGRENASMWMAEMEQSPSPRQTAQSIFAIGFVLRAKSVWVLVKLCCSWVLATNLRTWSILIPLTMTALLNVAVSQGWGSAFLALPFLYSLSSGVKHLRERWNITGKRNPDP